MPVAPSAVARLIRRRRGFVMLEVLFALTIFGVGAVALLKALTMTSRLAVESQMDVRLLLRLQSKLNYFSKLNNLEEWDGKTERTDADEMGIWTETLIERMQEIKNADGQELQQMYRIYVKAFYRVEWKTEPEVQDLEIWRYLPLYRTGSAGPSPTR